MRRIGRVEFWERWKKIGSRPLKRVGRLYCERLSKRLNTENRTAFTQPIFYIKLGKTSKKTHDIIKKAYGAAAMDRLGIFE